MQFLSQVFEVVFKTYLLPHVKHLGKLFKSYLVQNGTLWAKQFPSASGVSKKSGVIQVAHF
jgi:hypothetical protein